MIVVIFIFNLSADPAILFTQEKKRNIFSATEDFFSDVAFDADARLTPYLSHNWKQTNKQTNKHNSLLVSDFS
jgi:hypothetical protein